MAASSSLSAARPPNLVALLGSDLTAKLIAKAGNLVQLTRLSDAALRHVGSGELQAAALATSASPAVAAIASRARHLHAGYLVEATVFTDCFGTDDVVYTESTKSAAKALALLGRKAALVAKTDLAGGFPDGAFGEAERAKLVEAFARLRDEGKVSEVDTQALPVPEVRKRGEVVAKKRGGLKEHRKREAQSEPVGVVERALSRVKMGVSEEEQREALLQRTDIRVELMKEQEKQREKEDRKRRREEPADEYDDLLHITL